MKKFKLLPLIASLLFVMAVSASAEKPIKVVVGGEQIKTDVAPVIVNDRTLVPLRAIFEALDATVDWDGATQTVIATKDDTAISLQIGNDKMFVNGTEVTLDVPAQLIEDRTMVPISAISESFGNEVLWNDVTRTVRVKKGVWLLTEWLVSSGYFREKYDYDEYGNLIYHEYIDGSWDKNTYDEYGNLIYQENSKKKRTTYTYDENGNMTYQENSNGFWNKYTYDEFGNAIYRESSDGTWCKFAYDEYGNIIYQEDSNGIWYKYIFDKTGNMIYREESNGRWYKWTRDENGNAIYGEESNGIWYKYVFDETGNMIYREDSNGDWEKYDYDEFGNEIYYENSSDYWAKKEYTYFVI